MDAPQLLYQLARQLLSSLDLELIIPGGCRLLVDSVEEISGCYVAGYSGVDGKLYLLGNVGEIDYSLLEPEATECFLNNDDQMKSEILGFEVQHRLLLEYGFGLGVVSFIGKNLDNAREIIDRVAQLFTASIQNGASYKNLIYERAIYDQSTREMRDLFELTRSLTTAFKPHEVIQILLNGVSDIFRCEIHSLLLVDNNQGSLYSKFFHAFDDAFSETLRTRIEKTWRVLERSAIQIVENKVLSVNNRVDINPNLTNQKEVKIRSWLSAPLVRDDISFGLLILASLSENRFNNYQLEILYIVASLASKVIENARLTERLQMLATIDGLTGVFNHRTFQEKLEEMFNLARRYKHPLSLIMFDIDFFKRFNDTYGHQIGDEVLKMVSAATKKTLREVDVICRYGGEEFAIILPHIPLEDAYNVAERIRQQIENQVFSSGKLSLHVTISLGVSAFPNGNQTKREDLIKQADSMLYIAKKKGRNQVVAWSEEYAETPEKDH